MAAIRTSRVEGLTTVPLYCLQRVLPDRRARCSASWLGQGQQEAQAQPQSDAAAAAQASSAEQQDETYAMSAADIVETSPSVVVLASPAEVTQHRQRR